MNDLMKYSYITGIDVSHHNAKQPIFDIAVSSQIDFIIAKATEGKTYKDKEFDYYMNVAYNQGLLRGAYHYVNSDNMVKEDAIKEVENFLSYTRPYGDCILALDFEEKKMLNAKGVEYLLFMAIAIKQFTGVPPMIYTSESNYKTLDFTALAALGCGLWAAKWGISNPCDLCENGFAFNRAIAKPFSVLALQQVSNKAIWDEEIINLDVDVAFMSTDAWSYYANPRLRK